MDFICLETLDQLTRQFANWRASCTNKAGRIPNRLWDKVFGILYFYSIEEVTTALGLTAGQIATKRKQRKIAESTTKTLECNQFVEIDLQSSMPNNLPVPVTDNKIEIRRPDGSVLMFDNVSEYMMLQVLSQFTKVA